MLRCQEVDISSPHIHSAHILCGGRGHCKPEADLCRDSKATRRTGQARPPQHALLQGHLLFLPDGSSGTWDGCLILARLLGGPEWELRLGPQLQSAKARWEMCFVLGGKHPSSGPAGPWCNPSCTPSPDCTQLGSLVQLDLLLKY